MLAYVDLQTPPLAGTTTVTDDISPGPPGGATGPSWNGGPAQGLKEIEISSLGGPDYVTINGVRREQDGRHSMCFQRMFTHKHYYFH